MLATFDIAKEADPSTGQPLEPVIVFENAVFRCRLRFTCSSLVLTRPQSARTIPVLDQAAVERGGAAYRQLGVAERITVPLEGAAHVLYILRYHEV